MKVLIAEKPSQAKAYADALGRGIKKEGYFEIGDLQITWAVGHLVELKPPHAYDEKYKKWSLDDLPIIPERFQFQVSKGKTKQFNIIKNLMEKADEIIIGTDIDREGENIARLIVLLAGVNDKPIKRLWINSLEATEIKKGMANLRDGKETYNYFQEAQARQISDWIVGLNLTRNYTISLQQAGYNDVFTAGRVQTPTLYMIFQRDQEIKNFKPEIYFEIHADITHEAGKYKGKLKRKFKSQEEAQKTIASLPKQGKVTKIEEKDHKKKPPKLYNLSDLQVQLNKTYKFSPAKTLKLVQSLYDKKLVTYPRTDCNYITENEYGYIKENIKMYAAIFNVQVREEIQHLSSFVNNKKVEEHYAIIPTRQKPNLDDLTKDERETYLSIVKRVVKAFLPDYEYSTTTIETSFGEAVFISKGKVENKIGWKELVKENNQKTKKDDNEEQSLPLVKENDDVLGDIKEKEKVTKSKQHYTEGQLINLMKNAGRHIENEDMKNVLNKTEGLGTEATRSSIIEQLFSRNYIVKDKSRVKVTKKGEILCRTVEGTLLSSPELTGKWESFLHQIGKGKKTKNAFIDSSKKLVYKLIKETKIDESVVKELKTKQQQEDSIALCPSCKKGYIVDRKKFFGCTGYKDGCKQTFPKKFLGKNLTKKQIEILIKKHSTNLIKGFKSKKGNKFDAYIILKEDGNIELKFPEKLKK